MSTQSVIAVKSEASGVGIVSSNLYGGDDINRIARILCTCYSDEVEAEELIQEGDISHLDEYLYEHDDDVKHSFENRSPGVCVFYHRDRGDRLYYKYHQSEETLIRESKSRSGSLFFYKNEKWHVLFGNQFIEITPEMFENVVA